MKHLVKMGLLLTFIFGYQTVEAQLELAQQAYTIFQQNCLNCHGPHGSYTEQLIIESAQGLIATGTVVPGNPDVSEFYKRLLGPTENGAQMPFAQPPLPPAAIETIQRWIAEGAQDWEVQHDITFITTDEMLTAIQAHLVTLEPFDRAFARYFTLTHLYNAGESLEALGAYQLALSKLINSLSWGFEIRNPVPIDTAETIFYIDLRHYEWDRNEAWTQMEQVYPYNIEFDPVTQAGLIEKLTNLRAEMNCQVPFMHVDWFLGTASLPPLYHDILDLPETDRELERDLDVNVARNIENAPGVHVRRAGFKESGVSNNNRVVERHTSRYGAYWKSYDFAGNIGTQDILTHPLSFTHDGGEVVFNLPNGLQAYYVSDASGNRIDEAPITIVRNLAASDPTVRNGLSCIGCHTEGMKTFEDEVRAVFEKQPDSAIKAQVLRLYVAKSDMDAYVEADTQRYKTALEKTGGVFGGIEPVSRFYEAFHGPLDAPHAAAAVGLETETFLKEIHEKPSLRNLGLAGLLDGGNVKRDTWTEQFSGVISALNSEDAPSLHTSIVTPDRRTPTGTVYIPDVNLRAAIEAALGKTPGTVITSADMARLTHIIADEKGISDLTGLEHATNLERIEFRRNAISDLSPLAGLIRLNNIKLRGNKITDVSPLAELINVDWLGLEENEIKDLSPLKGLVKLNGIGIEGNPVSDLSPLAELLSLEGIRAWRTPITDFSPLAKVRRLKWLEISDNKSLSTLSSLKEVKSLRRLDIHRCAISDLSGLEALIQLTSLTLPDNLISDVSVLKSLKALTHLNLERNVISDVSPLEELTRLKELHLNGNVISDVSPLAGLTNLERLNLANNAISDFSPLEGLAEKIYIQAKDNAGVLLQGGPKITGPWLWVVLPGGGFHNGKDLLAQASGGKVTELSVATKGAIEGEPIGNNVWTSHKIAPNGQNTRELVSALDIDESYQHRVMYGSVILHSHREQQTTMFAGSDDNHKVWLNGKLINEKYQGHDGDYEVFFPTILKQGKNVLLVAVFDYQGGWHGAAHFGFAPDAEYRVLPPGTRFSLSTESTQVEVSDTFTLHLRTEDITDLAGWQADIKFDPAVLKVNSVTEGSFLRQSGGRTYFRRGTIDNTTSRIKGLSSLRISEGGVSGEGTLLSVKFTAIANGESRVSLRNFQAGSSTGETIPTTPPEIFITVAAPEPVFPTYDVNEDGVTDAIDAQLVAAALGQRPPENPRTDVNGDGIVDGKDLILVAEHLGEGAAPAAPSNVKLPPGITIEMVEYALDVLRAVDDGSLTFQRGIANLEQLLALFVPEKTALLPNYPNPFNPETWIPYDLAESADVTVHIYAINGVLVRTLALGYQPAGIYQYRSRAAYWDGKNEMGESVASGVYFYTLTAGNFTATKKMLIRK